MAYSNETIPDFWETLLPMSLSLVCSARGGSNDDVAVRAHGNGMTHSAHFNAPDDMTRCHTLGVIEGGR